MRININKIKPPSSSYKINKTSLKMPKEVKETVQFYKSNANDGWIIGRRLAKQANQSKVPALLTKIYWTVAKTRIRTKDILPITLAGIGTATPFPGAGLAGFISGRAIEKAFTASLKSIKKYLTKKS